MYRIGASWRKVVLVPVLAVAAPASAAGAAVPFEEPRMIVDRVGVVRTEQGLRVDLAPGAGRAALFEDTGAGGGYVRRQLVVRAADGAWTRPVRVLPDARIAGNAAGDVAVAGSTNDGVEVRFLARDAVAPAVESLPGAGELNGAPGLAEDGTLVLLTVLDGTATLRRRAPDGTWTATAVDGGALAGTDVAVTALGVLPEPDGSTRLIALTVRSRAIGLLHVRIQADGSLVERNETALDLAEVALFGLARGGAGRVPLAVLPGGAAVVVLPDAVGSRPHTFRLLAYTHSAGGGWTRSVVRTQTFTYRSDLETQNFGAAVALDADGTAVVAYGSPWIEVYVRPAGAARWGRGIPLQAMDSDQGIFAAPGLALASGQLRAAWGANPFLLQRGGNHWSLVERGLAVGPASAAGGDWPTVLASLAPVRAIRSGLRTRIVTSVGLARGPATVFVALDACTPRCAASPEPEHAIQGRVGRNAISFARRLVPGRYRVRVYTFGAIRVQERSRLVVVP
jgi:hypothetical protein